MQTERVNIAGEELVLHPYRAAYWEARHTLLVADLHLGKALHFRRQGIPVPAAVGNENWDKLIALLLEFEPRRVLILGDLFHSEYNSVWEDFDGFIKDFAPIEFALVLGNHDILDRNLYEKAGLVVYQMLYEAPFIFTHEPLEEPSDQAYNLCGHIHPGIKLCGGGASLRLPCFFFGVNQGIMAAFGAFTGLYNMQAKREDQVFVVTDQAVINMSGARS